MEARELRIGNWIDWDDKSTRSIVKGIHPSGTYAHLENRWIGLHRCDPIPLTEEWLVRFWIHIDGQSISLKSGTIGVIQRGREGMFKYYLQSAFGMVHLDSIKYVHQLQNIYFALTGEELELKQ